ncbi:bifunctional phosphopantothenoylcysteine decarboxylase/phosphopantothenate--cysteine ligase CoaBC [Sporolactobacillus inulinus]|uniref:Coenzyme A biosynthesis bifunctional protein CoaBC n=1 Tax=Sporolactobacillus inulinus CASD TaxID=1069536 RepID=A0A0U1QM04_9BACL|nr:bifunctional phosphopantothenoylcysteine decarboxylase/phosphopantothenate--cysteine ligase CoaBC [Sporolactobacillus inulinus]KLI01840.1 phosphopantothenoylcysteine decarboxylase [Sporolactobacillus inulinus CASD]GEB75856.1 putative coenzyme A biosynthesis bifunctional protein CoaBC [Sporolactobacillus inulinus]
MTVEGKKILLGICGGIAAYKSADLASRLKKAGADVSVVMTESAKQFIGPVTFQGLTRHRVYDHVFLDEKEGQIAHIDLADEADLMIIAPATAQTIARLAQGFADDMLTTVALATKAPIWVAPAMNVHMYEHPAVQHNLQLLESYGYHVIGPAEGHLACGWVGAGRMTEPADIMREIESQFSIQKLSGKKLLVTAGPTKEALDPIRFLSNQSSGKMGYAIAEAARQAGAEVTLISGASLADPKGMTVVHVTSAQEMHDAVMQRFATCDAVIKAAAVADYRPEHTASRKIKKSDGPMTLTMVRNPDILKALGEHKKDQLLVGFAAETDHLEDNAKKKLNSKHLDMLVANHASDGFGSETNKVTLYFADGRKQALERMQKQQVARHICNALSGLFEMSVSK